MAFLSSLNIPLSGMTAERFRLDKRQMVVFGEDKTFKSVLATKLGTGETHYHKYIKYRGVEAKQVVDDPTPAEPVYDPTHPLADERGYVYESNVDVATEQLDSTEAENMYSANLAVVKSMATKALNIGKS